jgi:hypothetical protein
VLREGRITVDLGDVRRHADINSSGEVTFPGVSSDLEGTDITILTDVPGFEWKPAVPVTIPADHVISLGLVPREYATALRGSVRTADGRVVRDATITVGAGSHTATTDEQGNFSVVVPLAPGTVVGLAVTVDGRVVFDEDITVAEQPALRIVLRDPRS